MSPIRLARAAACCLALATLGTAAARAEESSYRVVRYFPGTLNHPNLPAASLTALGGLLYGLGTSDDPDNLGAVFSVDPTTRRLKILHQFNSGGDGQDPSPGAGLVALAGVLYGTTYDGGAHDAGTVFSVDPATRTERILFAFPGGARGSHPASGLVAAGGRLWGTTTGGGAYNGGVAFSVDPATGSKHVVHDFGGAGDGTAPTGTLLKYAEGVLAGTTSSGGNAGGGTAFILTIANGAVTTLHSFQNSPDGYNPAAGLARGGRLLYGTTTSGGTAGQGTVFSIDPASGDETILHSFQGKPDGSDPKSVVIKSGNRLFGTTYEGGKSDEGTIYSVTVEGASYKLRHAFSATDGHGYHPYGGVIKVGATLYGTTEYGGSHEAGGTLFAFVP